jgi:predicted ATPase/GAF domain-containing protein/tRNA A-37 threonylcarbamoyl transferase component Bud32
MKTINNYQIIEKIFDSANTLVYRGQKTEDNQPVILKVLKENYPSPEKLTHYRQEYEITRDLNIEGVIDAYNLEKYQKTLMIVLEDFGGKSLDKLFNSPLDLSKFLSLAIQITEILGEIHAADVIHKDINPSNIILNPNSGQLKMIDFGISTILPRENPALKNPNQLEGTLHYLSPEQTGRMNRALDYRSDFYSLGVTFYELLTQQLPFESQDAMELVHCHLAKQPTPPHDLNPDIPPVISNIILKLLAKTAEERYQSAWGLKTDLQACQLQFAQNNKIETFTLGQQDFSSKFQLPQKLYGREREIKNLLTAFERASQGQREMMLVTGYAGIGKSALVQEIYKPITQKRGYFISGKFDQLQRNIPYAAFVNAFAELVRQLLTEDEAQLQGWKEKILAAVAPNGQVIIEIIPEIHFILGEQPDVPQLPPAESQNRFNLVFQNFIKVFTKPEHPLVIFLDDLQWVDSASLKLMQLLMESADIHALFLIGAYRDDEVNAIHPLRLTLKEIQKAKAVVNQISIEPLTLGHVNQLIADALHCDLGRAHPLAELVHTKTGGNPFFLNEFLKSLFVEKLLNVKQGHWQWDLPQIQARDFTDNVVELMVEKIQQLSVDTQQALKFAACIGSQFDLSSLAVVSETTSQQIATHLREAIISGLLSVINKQLATEIDLTTDNWLLITECQFTHDRIQQAAYSLISDEQKPVVHQQIGQLLLKNTPLDEREAKIFAIVDQLNVGKILINQQSERDELAQLNLIAGKKAKASAAYQPAFDYLKIGLGLLGDDCWQTQYDFSLALHGEAAEAAYLSGNFEKMEKLVEVVLQQAKTALDKVKAYEVKIQARQAQGQPEEALKTGLQVLDILGIRFPKIFRNWHIWLRLLKTKFALFGKQIEDLTNLPEITDHKQRIVIRILARTWVYAYMTDPELFALMCLEMVNLSLKQGNVPETAGGYVGYAILLCGLWGNIEAGHQFGELAFSILHRFNSKEYQAKVIFIVHALIKHWKHHLRKSIMPLRETYQIGLDTGDLEFAGYAITNSYFFSYFTHELSGIEQKMGLWADTLSQLKQGRILNNLKIYHQALLNLIGRSANTYRLIGDIYDEQTMQPQHEEANDKTLISWLCYHKLTLCYLFDVYSQALKHAIQTETYLDGITGYTYVPIFHFYDSLVRLALYKTATKQEQRQYRKKVQANQKKMKKWAHHAPMNYLHKFYLVEAEWHHHVLGENAKAMDLYEQAIELARENEYINEEALAYELAAKFYMAKGKDKIAQVYFNDAHYAYTRWGAMAKVKHLEEHYPQFFENKESAPSRVTLSGTTRIQDTTILDLNSVLKASQTIASELDRGVLLKKMMKIVLENAGAQQGWLILEKDGQWFIEAEGTIDKDEVTELKSIPLSQLLVPQSLIDYVIRTKKSVVLPDAAHEEQFTSDSYIVENQVKSVLCLPLLVQGKVTGLLYLENNLATNVFITEKVAVLELLLSQIAMSIKNARAYKEMMEMNIDYQKKIAALEQQIKKTVEATS